jgi:hypothetical protein
MDAIRTQERADHFRQEANCCLELAERKAIVGDRAWLVEMAQHWLDMAIEAEAAEQFSSDVATLNPPTSLEGPHRWLAVGGCR